MKERWPGILLIVLVMIVWELASYTELVNPLSLPLISKVLVVWAKFIFNGDVLTYLMPSLGRIFPGFFLAVLIAVPVGLLMGTNRFVFRLLEPITEIIRPIPASAYIPVAILFFGIGNEMKIFVIVLTCFFPILLNTYSGVRAVDPVLIDTGRTFGVSKMKTLWQIILPASLPNIFTGMRISLGISLIVSVVAEMISGNDGIGYYILDMQRIFKVSHMFAGIFTLGVLGYTLNFVFLKIEKYFLRWRAEHEM
jgi:ABC-type nitrate/sulfonate/bicarbonate transport system permease component